MYSWKRRRIVEGVIWVVGAVILWVIVFAAIVCVARVL